MIVRLCLFAFGLLTTAYSYAAESTSEQDLASLTPPVTLSTLAETALGLIIVLGFIVLLAWLLKRTQHLQATANGKLKIIAGLPVGTRERIVLIEAGNEQVLVGITPQQIQTLHVLKDPITVDTTSAESTNSFADKLKQVLNQQGKS